MQNQPIQTQPASLSSAVSLLCDLLASLEVSLENNRDASPENPDFGSLLDRQILHQEASSLQELRTRIDADAYDDAASSNYIRVLSLFERTRARIARDSKFAAAQSLRELELAQLEPRSQPDRAEARQFLQTELSRGDRPAKELIELARAIGIAPRTLKRAKADLDITSQQVPHPQSKHSWVWSLPTTTAADATTPSQP